MIRPRALVLLAGLVAAAGLLAACEEAEPERPPPPAVAVAAGARSFTVGGTFSPGVNRITFTNAAETPRNAQLVRLDEGATPADLLAVVEASARWPDWAHYVGGPGLTAPGRSMSYETVLFPGQYVMLSLLPDNGGALRVVHDVVQAFAVTGEETGAAETRANLEVTTRRRELRAPASVDGGEVRLRLTNEDDTPHDASVFALREGATAQDAVAYLDGRLREAPGEFVGGVQAVEPGESGLAVLFLTPGEYALVSLFPEPDGLTPGFQVGLVRGLTVK